MRLYEIKFLGDWKIEETYHIVANDMAEAMKITFKESEHIHGKEINITSCKLLADEKVTSAPGMLMLGEAYRDETVELLTNMIPFLEELGSEANLGDHELDCDGESCVLCSARELYNKLISGSVNPSK